MNPASYNRWASCIVFETEKCNLREASCCSVDVVKGGAGDFLAGFVSRSVTEKLAPIFCCKKSLASSLEEKVLFIRAFIIFPSELMNSAVTL